MEIGNKRWNLWKTLKTIARGTNNLVGLTADALTIAQAIKELRKPQSTENKTKPSESSAAKLVVSMIIENLFKSALSGGSLRKRKRNWLIKGSAEAKAYMARLRTMRGCKQRAYY